MSLVFAEREQFDVPNATLELWHQYASESLFDTLLAELNWQRPVVTVYGKRHKVPRRVAWVGDEPLSYSGITHSPTEWPESLALLRATLEQDLGTVFNGVLANHYRDGNDTMGWHSDNEPELGDKPVIASISLGAERRFKMRHRDGQQIDIHLPDRSLLVMAGDCQQYWQHALPKQAGVKRPRINLTFRHVLSKLA